MPQSRRSPLPWSDAPRFIRTLMVADRPLSALLANASTDSADHGGPRRQLCQVRHRVRYIA